jgi:hypothetical protein
LPGVTRDALHWRLAALAAAMLLTVVLALATSWP